MTVGQVFSCSSCSVNYDIIASELPQMQAKLVHQAKN